MERKTIRIAADKAGVDTNGIFWEIGQNRTVLGKQQNWQISLDDGNWRVERYECAMRPGGAWVILHLMR